MLQPDVQGHLWLVSPAGPRGQWESPGSYQPMETKKSPRHLHAFPTPSSHIKEAAQQG